MKSAQLRIRMEPDLHQAFLEVCHEQDESAAQFLRKFMRAYVESAKKTSRGGCFNTQILKGPLFGSTGA